MSVPSESGSALSSSSQSAVDAAILPQPQAVVPESGAGPHAGSAGFWIRLAAWAVDLACLALVTVTFIIAAVVIIYLGAQLGGEINDRVVALAGYAIAAIVMFGGVVYCTIFVGSGGQTPGKMLFRLKVVRMDGQEVTYGGALLRSLCWMLSLLPFGIGFLLIVWSRQKRGLHDILAGTSVIRLQRLP